jgi:hypothetical protein
MNLQKLYELSLAETKAGKAIRELPSLAKTLKKHEGHAEPRPR